MAMKVYCIFTKATELEPHHQIVSYTAYSLRKGSYPSLEMQSVYSTAPTDRAGLIGVDLNVISFLIEKGWKSFVIFNLDITKEEFIVGKWILKRNSAGRKISVFLNIYIIFGLFIRSHVMFIHITSPQPSGIFFQPSSQSSEIFFCISSSQTKGISFTLHPLNKIGYS